MRSIVPAASIALAVLGGSASALAQDVDVEINAGAPSYHEYTEPVPRARYYYRTEPPVVAVPVRPESCGEFRYWDGSRCVDARRVPPDVSPR